MRASPASPLSCGRPPCHHSPAMLCVCVCACALNAHECCASNGAVPPPVITAWPAPTGRAWTPLVQGVFAALACKLQPLLPRPAFCPTAQRSACCSRTVAVRLCALVHEGVAVLQELHRRLLDVVDSLARHGCGGTKLLPREVRHGRPRLPVSCRQGRSEPSLCLRVPTTRCSPRETDAWPLPDLRLR